MTTDLETRLRDMIRRGADIIENMKRMAADLQQRIAEDESDSNRQKHEDELTTLTHDREQMETEVSNTQLELEEFLQEKMEAEAEASEEEEYSNNSNNSNRKQYTILQTQFYNNIIFPVFDYENKETSTNHQGLKHPNQPSKAFGFDTFQTFTTNSPTTDILSANQHPSTKMSETQAVRELREQLDAALSSRKDADMAVKEAEYELKGAVCEEDQLHCEAKLKEAREAYDHMNKAVEYAEEQLNEEQAKSGSN
ncbi:hypothetical protein F4677DRAFT_444411 [Hypoxylon crocopeplum]|nr:hypothetical protein F4677DRAFT_444411 [Hypoxylon crocopeplum]